MGKHSIIESQKHYVNCKETYKKRLHTVQFYSYEILEKPNLSDYKQIHSCQGSEGVKRIVIAKGRREHFGVIGIFYIFIVYIFQIIYLNLIYFYLELYIKLYT